jgi:succinate dehydrogenase / fumarate reductase flavoprotein subunit
VDDAIFTRDLEIEEKRRKELLHAKGKENVHQLHDELADFMVRYASVKRDNPDLGKTMTKIKEIRERYKQIQLDDQGHHLNQTYVFAHQFGAMLELALVIVKGAFLRNEFRGAHYKPEFPKRDDEHWLKTTIATYAPDEPHISYEPVDTRHVKPVLRDYTEAKKKEIHLENIPETIVLPF